MQWKHCPEWMIPPVQGLNSIPHLKIWSSLPVWRSQTLALCLWLLWMSVLHWGRKQTIKTDDCPTLTSTLLPEKQPQKAWTNLYPDAGSILVTSFRGRNFEPISSFRIVLDLQKSCRENTKNSHPLLTQLRLMLTSYITLVHLSQLWKHFPLVTKICPNDGFNTGAVMGRASCREFKWMAERKECKIRVPGKWTWWEGKPQNK